MALFDSASFESDFRKITSGSNTTATPLKLNVCVICGSFGSNMNIKDFVDNLIDSEDLNEFEDDPDATILIDVEKDLKNIKIIVPTEKYTVAKIIKKEYPLQPNTIRIRYKPNCKKSKIKKKKGEDAFYNCINVEFIVSSEKKTPSNISAKLFPNGKVQVAGCKDLSVCNVVPQILFDFVSKYGKESIINPEIFKIQDFRIVMLKTSFKFICGELNLEALKDKINQHNVRTDTGLWRNAVYEPGTFPGLNAKHWQLCTKEKHTDKIKSGKNVGKKIDGQSTVIVFRQGNASITGAKTVEELSSAYHDIIDIVQKYRDEVIEVVDDSDSDDETLESMVGRLSL